MTPKQTTYENQANTIIKALSKRHMDGHFFHTSQEAVEFINQLIIEESTISWGGSMTLSEIGLFDSLKQRNLNLLDRSTKKTPEEINQLYRDVFSADHYLMSTNAITLDGKLVNIDGNGNRVAALIFGPKQVIVVAGMNKVALNERAAIERVHNIASPPNTVRLNKNTPCATTGYCNDCLSDDCICSHTVITRNSRHPNRIQVILIGEDLGY
jgi:hypothetical protein